MYKVFPICQDSILVPGLRRESTFNRTRDHFWSRSLIFTRYLPTRSLSTVVYILLVRRMKLRDLVYQVGIGLCTLLYVDTE